MPSIRSNTSSDNSDKASNCPSDTIGAAGKAAKAAKKQSREIPQPSSSDKEEEATPFANSTETFVPKKTKKLKVIEKTFVPKKTKKLKVIEKFREKAALYRPSEFEGGGWNIIGGKGSGGEVILQMQVDAKNKDKYIPVVRYETQDGEARVNARIPKGLPIHRKGKRNVLFKTVSSSSRGGINAKTIFQAQFESEDKTNGFMKLWYELAENGSTSLGEDNVVLHDSTNRDDATSFDDDDTVRAVLCDSTNNRNDATAFDGTTTAKDVVLRDSSNEDAASSDDEETEVEIDEEYAPETQNWMAAFSRNDENF